MKIKVPDYYHRFSCKCGACRHCCCKGWNVSISFQEYCQLKWLDADEKVKNKILQSLDILEEGTMEQYAHLKKNPITGSCLLQREDGLCTIQAEVGEQFLPLICQLYPRNIVHCVNDEGALANSCEKVIELLMDKSDEFGLETIESPYAEDIEVSDEDKEIQRKTFAVLHDRSLSLDERFIALGKALDVDDGEIEKCDDKELFTALIEIIDGIKEYSPTFKEYAALAKKEIGPIDDSFSGENIFNRYNKAKESFSKSYPEHEKYFENIMSNHLFYIRFPYLQKEETIFDKYIELCATFVLLRFITVTNLEYKNTKEDFVDSVSNLFRVFEHSNSDQVILTKLKRLGLASYPFIKEMIHRL